MWNYRILAHEHKGEIYLRIHSVLYDENNSPDLYGSEPAIVGGDSVTDIIDETHRMNEACGKPILWYGDRWPEVYEPAK